MEILTSEQRIINDARSRAGAVLKQLGLTGRQRQQWLDRHGPAPLNVLLDAIRREFGRTQQQQQRGANG